ncbi:MAG: helicase-related protein [Alphaproteobacteria bacterium]|nr:helicase-related protein [Alphaproteobacteria bacterium]
MKNSNTMPSKNITKEDIRKEFIFLPEEYRNKQYRKFVETEMKRGIKTCLSCRKQKNYQMTLHHVLPLGVFGSKESDTLAPLCIDCHKAVTYRVKLHTTQREEWIDATANEIVRMQKILADIESKRVYTHSTFEKFPEKPFNARDLPISEKAADIMQLVDMYGIVIVSASTGSGKTMLIPELLQRSIGGKVFCTQPRRIAARSAFETVALTTSEGTHIPGKLPTNEYVGYRTRHKDHTVSSTKVIYGTAGILRRQLEHDPLLSEYRTICIDEQHERSIDIDLITALVYEAYTKRKGTTNPLSIVIMSATLSVEYLQKKYTIDPQALIEVTSRRFPVDLHFLDETPHPSDTSDAGAHVVEDILKNTKYGDVLVFMPGKYEVEQTIVKLKEKLGERAPYIFVPVHADLSADEQQLIYTVAEEGTRKIIVATNIAETSLTIPNIAYVVDSGLKRENYFNTEHAINELRMQYISLDEQTQRTGRVGRQYPGAYYALYSPETTLSFKKQRDPEILRASISRAILTLASVGVRDFKKFPFVTAPKETVLEKTANKLTILGALRIDEQGRYFITDEGRVLIDLPLEPHIGKILIHACASDALWVATPVLSLMSERSPFIKSTDEDEREDATVAHKKYIYPYSDFFTMLKIWAGYVSARTQYEIFVDLEAWAKKEYLRLEVLERAEENLNQLYEVLADNKEFIATITSKHVQDIANTINSHQAKKLNHTNEKISTDTLEVLNGVICSSLAWNVFILIEINRKNPKKVYGVYESHNGAVKKIQARVYAVGQSTLPEAFVCGGVFTLTHFDDKTLVHEHEKIKTLTQLHPTERPQGAKNFSRNIFSEKSLYPRNNKQHGKHKKTFQRRGGKRY